MESKSLVSYLNFETIIQPLIPYMETGICSKTLHNKISRCKYSILEHITNFLFNQQSLPNDIKPYYSSYSIDIFTQSSNFQTQTQVNFQTCYEEKYDKDAWPICFMKNNKNILLNIISPNTMCKYLLTNNYNKYCFIPILFCPPFSNDKNVPGHYTCLIIDNYESKVYFFDPNGWTSYFNDNVNYYETQKYLRLVEKLFEKYFEDLSDFTGIKYDFVSTFQWNPRNLNLNKRLAGSQVDNGGNCVGFTILFAHYLYLTKLPLRTCLENLANLEDSQKIQLINDYSVGLTRFIDPLLETYKKELYQKMLNEYKLSHPEFSSGIFENIFHKRIIEKINKIFDFDEPEKPEKVNELNVILPLEPKPPYENMSIDNYDPEKFELIYNKNKQTNVSNGIDTNIVVGLDGKKIINQQIKLKNSSTKINNTNELDDDLEKEYLKFFINENEYTNFFNHSKNKLFSLINLHFIQFMTLQFYLHIGYKLYLLYIWTINFDTFHKAELGQPYHLTIF